jgi:hypothetical protein
MTAVTLTLAIGLTLRVLVPLVLMLSLGTLVQARLARRQAVDQ